MRRCSLVLPIVLALATRAFADPLPEAATSLEHRARHATALSAAGTAVSVAAMAGGVLLLSRDAGNPSDQLGMLGVIGGTASLVFTPGLGHLYGENRLATPAMFVRSLGAATIVGGAVVLVADNFNFCVNDGNPCPATNNRGFAVMGVGAAVMLGGALVDIATAGDATRSHALGAVDVHVTPTAFRTADHRTAGGVGLTGTF